MNFQEAIKLIHECRTDPAKMNEHANELMDFVNEVETVGTNVLTSRGNEYAIEFVAIAQTIALILALRNSGDLNLLKTIMSENFVYLSARTLKIGLGLAVMDELR